MERTRPPQSIAGTGSFLVPGREPVLSVPGDGGEIHCYVTDPEAASAWQTFQEQHPRSNLGHAWEWRQVIERAYRKRCYYLAAARDGELAGILPLAHMRGTLAGNRLVSLPYLDQAGPLALDPAAEAALCRSALELAGRLGARGVDLRRVDREADREAERVTLVLPLPPSSEALWKSFKPKVRNQVRKAEKEGLRTERAGGEGLAEFYPIFARAMRDLGSPVHSRAFLEEVIAAFGTRARVYLTRARDGRPVGGAVALSCGTTVTVPWASALRDHFGSCPNHSLYWRILEEAVAAKKERFDFGRSYVGSGTYRFKIQWGSVPRRLSWLSLGARGEPEPSRALRPDEHRLLTRAWSKLPLAVANWLGPRLRHRLAN